MKEFTADAHDTNLFPYQLTTFMDKDELKPFIEPFKKYGEEDDGIIVSQFTEKGFKYAIFTEGEYAYTDKAIRERDEEVKTQLKGEFS